MIRFIAVCITVILALVLSIPLFGVYWIVGQFSSKKKDYLAMRTVQCTFKFILYLTGVDLTVIGEEKIPEGPVLYVGNHRSQFDTLLTYSRMKGVTGFVAKKEMAKLPILNKRMRDLYCLFLDRENPREGLKTILQAVDYIKDGISICIFPEGTRNKGAEGSLMEFKEGSFKIADKTGCPVVPIAITNAEGMFERQFPKMRKVKVIMEYCDPIYPDSLEKSERRKMGMISSNRIETVLKRNMKLL